MLDDRPRPPGRKHSASLKAITARQLQALVRRPSLVGAARHLVHREGSQDLRPSPTDVTASYVPAMVTNAQCGRSQCSARLRCATPPHPARQQTATCRSERVQSARHLRGATRHASTQYRNARSGCRLHRISSCCAGRCPSGRGSHRNRPCRNGAVRVGVVVLNRNAPFPPAPGNVDEVRVGGEEPAEGVHIVPIPCFSEARYYTSNSGRIRWPLGVTWSDPRQCQNETYRHNALHVSPPISARRRTYGRLTGCA